MRKKTPPFFLIFFWEVGEEKKANFFETIFSLPSIFLFCTFLAKTLKYFLILLF